MQLTEEERKQQIAALKAEQANLEGCAANARAELKKVESLGPEWERNAEFYRDAIENWESMIEEIKRQRALTGERNAPRRKRHEEVAR